MTTHMKGNEQYIHVIVFVLPYNVVLTLTLDETIACDL